MNYDYYAALEKRRSIYKLSKESPISDERLLTVIEHSLNHTPSAFNSQSGRVVLLLGKEHDDLWSMTESALKKIVPSTRFSATKEKMDAFKNAYGTVLFFEDYDVVEQLQNKFPRYKHNFPIWSYQSSGMLQYNIWTSLAVEGLGASLQHYNEVIEEEVRERWRIPSNWKMMSQMPFGRPQGPAADKEFVEISTKLRVYQ